MGKIAMEYSVWLWPQFNFVANTLECIILGCIIYLIVLGRKRMKVANAAYAALLEQLHHTLEVMTQVSERQLAWLDRLPQPTQVPPPAPGSPPRRLMDLSHETALILP